MDVLTISRLQFALTSMFHFIFVPLTIGLSVLVAWMEWRYVKTNDQVWLRMARFWGRLFLINFALGVVTGITLEFQFGMNWAEYSKYVGDIFGAPLAIEATVAFFLESVFIGVWIFGWDKVSQKTHALSITIVAFATNLSALWILLANGWMQNPVGAAVSRFTGNPLITERAEMSSFVAVITNQYGWIKFFHTVLAGYTVAAFFVIGISAWHLLRKREPDFFKRSFKAASLFGLVSAIAVIGIGDIHGADVARLQPTKLAAMESVWETTPGGTGFPILAIPDEAAEGNLFETLVIPRLASLLSHRDPDKPIIGLKDFPKSERPPVALTFFSFRLMVGIGFLMLMLLAYAVYLSWKGRLEEAPIFLKILPWAIPLPYIAGQLGWIVAEVGRQPWIVYGMLKTSDGVSRAIDPPQALFSLGIFIVLYSLLGAADFYLLYKYARKGPDTADQGLTAAAAGEV